ncbi:VWA domain-containing protein [Sulfuricystis multivorans]|uniref:VWA domain-containing protein n=1 Tax=Sulfuricystis multivorans TaxID=2211108 RepID=UPI000F82399F|nr:VWA domain-containing protein [Sulfuricystis multivorans]
MAMRAQSLDRALPAIAGFIADRTGIPIIRGDRAMTDNQAIYLPRRRSEIDLTERDLVESVAYLYHEAGHMLYSNFSLQATNPLQRAITGILEDIRIENLVMGRFPAARRYLSRLVGIAVEDGVDGQRGFPALDGSESEASILQRYMMYRLRHEVLRQEPIAELSAGAIKVAQQRLPAGMLTRLDALMFQVTDCASEDEVFELAAAIIQMIKEEREKEQEQKRQQQQKQQQQQQSGQQDGQDDDQQQGPSSGDPAEGDEEGGQGGQQGQADQDSESGGQGSSQSGSSKGEEGEASSQSARGAGGTGSGPDMEQALEQLLNMSDQDVEEDMGEMLQNAINAAANAEGDGIHVLMPNVHKAHLGAVPVDMAQLRASVNAIRTRTLQWMSSVAEGEVSYSRSGMQIDSSRIWQGRFGGAIFCREDEGIDINAAVSIVIDRSGSMIYAISDAVQAAVATMLAFDVPGLKTQVTVFPWYGENRDEGVAVIKRWDESPKQLAGRVASLSTDGGTPMAEAILFAASDIVRREETLKIVMVVTDGDPDDREATKYIIDRTRADGITVVGLGIGVDTSQVFDSRYAATIKDIGELSASMVKLVKAAFKDHHRVH